MNKISDRIKSGLKRRGMTQKQLAEIVGVTETAMSRYARGQRIPNAEVMMAIEEALREPEISSAKVEMIISYTTDGTDFYYHDNHGVLTRCIDCKLYNTQEYDDPICEVDRLIDPKPDDYCSRAERKEQP